MVDKRTYLKKKTKPTLSNFYRMLTDELNMPRKYRYKIIETLCLQKPTNYSLKEVQSVLEKKVK